MHFTPDAEATVDFLVALANTAPGASRSGAEQTLDLTAGAARVVVPAGQVAQVGHPDVGAGTPADRTAGGLVQGVPGQVEGPLHQLRPDGRGPTGGLDDRADQAGADDRAPCRARYAAPTAPRGLP